MNITETTIPDVSIENIDKSKIVLADSIIQNVYPLFDEVFNTRVEELESLQGTLKNKRTQVIEEKNSLQEMNSAPLLKIS